VKFFGLFELELGFLYVKVAFGELGPSRSNFSQVYFDLLLSVSEAVLLNGLVYKRRTVFEAQL